MSISGEIIVSNKRYKIENETCAQFLFDSLKYNLYEAFSSEDAFELQNIMLSEPSIVIKIAIQNNDIITKQQNITPSLSTTKSPSTTMQKLNELKTIITQMKDKITNKNENIN